MTATIIRVGTIGFPVSKKRLYPHVDAVERNEAHLSVPKPATGTKWREEAPGHVTFSLQLPKHLYDIPEAGAPVPGERSGYGGFKVSEENLRLFDRTVKLADNLGAQTLVLLTPATFTPAKTNCEALEAFLKAVKLSPKRIVWQPSGPWDHPQAAAYAARIGLTLAVDPLRDEPPAGPVAYLRLGPFAAMGSRVGIYDLERLHETATRFAEATIVFGTPRALDDARNLKNVIAESALE